MSKVFYDDLWARKTFKFSPSKLIRERWILYLLRQKVGFSNGDSFLDLGCGRGTLLKKVARAFPNAELFGADYSDAAVAANSAEQPKVNFKVLDFERSDLKNAFSGLCCVVSQEVIEHLSPKAHVRFLEAIADMLTNTGRAIITTPDWGAIQGLRLKEESDVAFAQRFENQPNANLLTYSQLEDIAVKAGFKVLWHKTVCPYVKNRHLSNLLGLILYFLPLSFESFLLERLGMHGKYQVILLEKRMS